MLNMKCLDYRITSDSYQVIVSKVRRDETGSIKLKTDKVTGDEVEVTSLVGYYANLNKALVAIQRDSVLFDSKDIQTVAEYKKELESITTRLEQELDFGEPFVKRG